MASVEKQDFLFRRVIGDAGARGEGITLAWSLIIDWHLSVA